MTTKEEEGTPVTGPSLKDLSSSNPRSLCWKIRCLLFELMSSIEVALEDMPYVL
jgi:hypothetical protein